MKLSKLSLALAGMLVLSAAACGDDDDTAEPDATEATAADDTAAGGGGGGGDFSSILLPKCTGIAVFDQANEGALEAAAELGVAEAEFVGPASCADSTGQVEFVTNAVTQGVDAIMVSNNAGDQIQTAVDDAVAAGIPVV